MKNDRPKLINLRFFIKLLQKLIIYEFQITSFKVKIYPKLFTDFVNKGHPRKRVNPRCTKGTLGRTAPGFPL